MFLLCHYLFILLMFIMNSDFYIFKKNENLFMINQIFNLFIVMYTGHFVFIDIRQPMPRIDESVFQYTSEVPAYLVSGNS